MDPTQLSDAVHNAEVATAHERACATANDEELTASQLLLADMVEREAAEAQYDAEIGPLNPEFDFETDWDSPQRREETVRRLAQGNIEPGLIATRMLAGSDQARHARDAVRAPIGNVARARPSAPQSVRVQEHPSRSGRPIPMGQCLNSTRWSFLCRHLRFNFNPHGIGERFVAPTHFTAFAVSHLCGLLAACGFLVGVWVYF